MSARPTVRRCSPAFVARRSAACLMLSALLLGCSVDAGVTVVRSDAATAEGGLPTGDTTGGGGETSTPDGPSTDGPSPDDTYEIVPGVVDFGDVEPSHPEYDGFITAAFADIEAFWAATFPAVYDQPWEPLAGGVYAASPMRSDPIPGCGESASTYDDVAEAGAFYCSDGDFMAYDDHGLLPTLVDQLGREAVAVVLAHEFGHAVQWRTNSFDQPTILLEQQADCFAGAWTAHVAGGTSDTIRFDDRGVRSGLIAMLEVRDPIDGSGLSDPQAHGSGFDRIGAFQDGYLGGAERCTTFFTENRLSQLLELTYDPFDSAGNLPIIDTTGGGSDIATLLPESLRTYWSGLTAANGVPFRPPTFVMHPPDDPLPCAPLGSATWLDSVAYCSNDNTVYWDIDAALRLLDEPLSGDMSVGYLFSTAYSEAVQDALGTSRTGERRALMNDCLTGTWAGAIVPPGSEPIFLSAGDLDEAIVTAMGVADASSTDDVVGSAFEKVDAFRAGVLGGLAACQDRFA